MTYQDLIFLLSPPIVSGETLPSEYPMFNSTTMQMFFSLQELYFSQIIESVITVIENTYTNYLASYESVGEIVFLIFLGFQLLMFLVLRVKLINTMREDIF